MHPPELSSIRNTPITPTWLQPRLFGAKDLFTTITLGYLGSRQRCTFGAMIEDLEADELVAMWAKVSYPISDYQSVAESGLAEVLEVGYSLR